MKNLIQCGAPREDFQQWLECGNGPLDVVRGKNGESGRQKIYEAPPVQTVTQGPVMGGM